jgi:hypothetical protein
MDEQEARVKNIKETDYCYVLARAWAGKENDSVCLERIFVKGGCEEIRLAWWNQGNQATRPADIEAENWAGLFSRAIDEGVFTDGEKLAMVRALLR